MPPRRRAAAGAQSTLSFGNQSRVTKPSTTPATVHKAKNLDSPLPTDQSASGTPEPQQVLASEPTKPHIAELVVRQQAAKEHDEPRSAEDERALKLSTQDLQTYWNKEEWSRKTPRGEYRLRAICDWTPADFTLTVHQKDLSLEEKILRHFDLSSQYGVCIPLFPLGKRCLDPCRILCTC